MPKTLVSEEDFRAAAKDGKVSADATLRKGFDAEVKVVDGEERKLDFTISTAAVDRMGDTVAVDGWKTDNYKKNPVVLWAHDSSMLPVGKSIDIAKSAGRLKSTAEFTPAGLVKFNDIVLDMYKGGFLSAVSVGFAPLKYNFVDDPARRYGIDFVEQELLEYSAVPVPANPEALIEGKAAGIDIVPILQWAEDAIRKAADVERVIKLCEDILGGTGDDKSLVAFAEKVIGKRGLVTMTRERVEKIEGAAKAQRLAKSRQRDLDLIRARG